MKGNLSVFFKYKRNRVWFIVSSIIIVIVLAVSLVINLTPLISVTMNQIFGGQTTKMAGGGGDLEYFKTTDAEEAASLLYYEAGDGIDSKSEALTAANNLNEKICEEGFVLLKNEEQLLPLENGMKITVFGKNAANLVYGSSGSGGSDHTGAKTIYDSLEAAGFQVNTVMKSFYEDNSKSGSGRIANPSMEAGITTGLSTGETPVSSYTDEQISSFSEYSGAAVVVLSRIGGEGWDLPRTMVSGGQAVEGAYDKDDHYLELDKNEQEMLKLACENFEKVVVIVNSSTPMELGFLDDKEDFDETSIGYDFAGHIQAAVWIGAPGNEGIMALGRILNGSVNPSGHLIDTYERQMELSPTWQNFSVNDDSAADADGLGDEYLVNSSPSGYYFVDYEEGIYSGYRYYETRAYEEAQAGQEEWYDSQVVFPFGYGLSYSEFEWELVDASESQLNNDTVVSVKVKVTNKESSLYAGKDVVQVYYTAPYYKGEIEKAQVVLAGYAKTSLLEPGQSETVEITFSAYDMASYDYNGANDERTGVAHNGYELDEGDYVITAAHNAHDALQADKSMQIKYHADDLITYDEDPVTGNTVENRFDDVSEGLTQVMSRADFEATFPKTPTVAEREVSQEFIDSLYWSWSGRNDEAYPYYTDEMPVFAQDSQEATAIQLYQMIGLDKDDPMWDEYLNQITVQEMVQIIGMGCYSTVSNTRIGKPSTVDSDGPVGLVNFFSGMVDVGQTATIYDVCSYASSCVTAATWNDELAYEEGISIGNECLIGAENRDGRPYTGWYAPAVNLHRSPFSGRNSEYYSEDGLISGNMAAAVVTGAKSKGVFTMVKHFAVNDQETHRSANGISVWTTEQAMRELYLKPFRIAVQDGESLGIMTSFNRLGITWAGGSYSLLTGVLREEWGFEGMVITDFNTDNTTYMNVDQMIRAGGDLDLAQDKEPSLVSKKGEDRLTPTQATLIRQAVHNILYVIANSNAMNGYGSDVSVSYGLAPWQQVNIYIDIVILLLLALWGFIVIRKSRKEEKQA
ncbi:MAG: glycoside hydrolase family 3 protein [Parasporobacterium sp.]|nr:glycoside hydrolase family 3 protein [Parasporobacterium sp.]